jgi:hypothetical protein
VKIIQPFAHFCPDMEQANLMRGIVKKVIFRGGKNVQKVPLFAGQVA